MNKYLSTITLNVNGLNAPIKRHRIAEWIRKHDPHICCLQETHVLIFIKTLHIRFYYHLALQMKRPRPPQVK